MKQAGIEVLVFGRVPRPGQVKTRLIPALGAAGAAALYRLLLQRALTTAVSAAVGPVTLYLDAEPVPDDLRCWLAGQGCTLALQVDGDLGARMDAALQVSLAADRWPLLMGSDLPSITIGHLQQGAKALAAGQDVVIAPALDGGYGVIGLTRSLPQLFLDMPWGTGSVLALTRRRLAELGVEAELLDPVWDVDEATDLSRLDALPDWADWRQRIEDDLLR